jgi:hypothetical protein
MWKGHCGSRIPHCGITRRHCVDENLIKRTGT